MPSALTVQDFHLVDESGRPFFWLADTAWNLWCKGQESDWDNYLSHRRAQGFNVIQFVAGWWRGSMNPIHGRPFDLLEGELVFNEAAWGSLDRLFERIRAHELVPAPVMLWTLTDIDPGQVLSEAQCIAVASRMAERWTQRDIVWFLGGDGNFSPSEVEDRWKRIGRAVFGPQPDQLATLHPCGCSWVCDRFAEEPWYRLGTIQSGHGSSEADLRFLVDGDYASAWQRLHMPLLNLEPNYEDAHSYGERLHLTAYHVRRASYWSLLLAPPAGVTFGIGSIWMWATQAGEIAENHDESWVGRPWHEELDTPGAESMTVLRRFFESLNWTELRPAPHLLQAQPGKGDLTRWVAAAESRDGILRVIYAPQGDLVEVAQAGDFGWRSIDPATGAETNLPDGRLTGSSQDGDILYVGIRR